MHTRYHLPAGCSDQRLLLAVAGSQKQINMIGTLSLDLTSWILLTDLVIRFSFSLRIIMRKRAASISFAWLTIILLLPFVGAVTYLLFGENRLGERRASRLLKGRPILKQWATSLREIPAVDWQAVNPECRPLNQQIFTTTGMPTMPGNQLELIDTAELFFSRLITDIDRAHFNCSLEFYIFNEGGGVDAVIEALIRAQERGVTCRLLLDSIGSKPFLRSQSANRLRKAGVEIREALPAGLIRALFIRIDLRNHRKIVVIDNEIAYTGSQNLVDPKFFRQDEQVGEWVDAMVRLTGPVVELLAAGFLFDWLLERRQWPTRLKKMIGIQPVSAAGDALVQLVPSGPGYGESSIHDFLLTAIYAARHELVLTTPYFVPDNAILAALRSAAQRGVEVTIIVPETNDSRLVHYASRANFTTLSQAGIRIMFFSGGLLHTKTITVDNDFCLFGSVNLDMRSFWLNFEMTLVIYDQVFTNTLRSLQQAYLHRSHQLDLAVFNNRPYRQQLLENIALLIGPLL
ncbi:cardiolipin synthase [Desulfobulbus oligotrophicus]|nr:cardiolipin synthase [Desulfobulbus oligotrophicus]MDY0389371.1 cardiolipin synthase [Desulfobulbus oligotrophicus]